MSKEHSLPSVRLPLVTLTPLFLGGADPRGDPELRASSVRGALRFWLRALLGGCYGTDDQALAEIRRLEAETFGEAGGEGKAGASKIVVRVRQEQQSAPQEWRAARDSGRAYLFFSPWHPRVLVTRRFPRGGLSPLRTRSRSTSSLDRASTSGRPARRSTARCGLPGCSSISVGSVPGPAGSVVRSRTGRCRGARPTAQRPQLCPRT